MRIAEVAISAIIGGAIGFAASQYVQADRDTAAEVAALVDARVDSRLESAGIKAGDDIDGRISGGVAQFLADQPEAVMAALEKHQANEQAREAAERAKAVADLSDALTKQAGDPAFGADAATAEVTLVEFFDYRCGYCKRSLETVMQLAADDPTLRVVMKEFPILGPESVAASRVSLAANMVDPSLYKDFHAALMRHNGSYDAAALLAVAAASGYDPVKVEAAMADDAVTAQIRNGYEIAEALGIRGTPAFVIGETVIPGAVGRDRLLGAIEAARAAKKG